MSAAPRVVFLVDVDNTLLDNDRVQRDLREHLISKFGEVNCNRYWELFEQLRAELGYADYLGALQRYRLEHEHEPRLLGMSWFLIEYPFAERLYPHALEVIAHLKKFGTVAILSDGDVVFQPRKVGRSGIYRAVDRHVLIFIHKERELDEVERCYPADHYVLVDDKLRILASVKEQWGDRVTTVFPRQGHYALDAQETAKYPPADVTIEAIGDLLRYDVAALLNARSR